MNNILKSLLFYMLMLSAFALMIFTIGCGDLEWELIDTTESSDGYTSKTYRKVFRDRIEYKVVTTYPDGETVTDIHTDYDV